MQPGEWVMFDDRERIAVIREVRLGAQKETMFRAVTWADRSEERVLIGYFPHRTMAAEITWQEYRRALERTARATPRPPAP
jgi:hypothetical protein